MLFRSRQKMEPKYLLGGTPASLAQALIADLGNGEETWNGDRTSSYLTVAHGTGDKESSKVYISLIEEKANIPNEEWGYTLHIINNVDGANCVLKSTDTLEEKELIALLEGVLDELNCKEAA